MMLMSTFVSYWNISNTYFHPPIVKATNDILTTNNKLSYKQFYFLEMLVRYCYIDKSFQEYALNNLIELVIDNLAHLHVETKMIISCLAIKHQNIHKIILDVLSREQSFSSFGLTVYDATAIVSDFKNMNLEWPQIIPKNNRLSFVEFVIDNIDNAKLKKLLKISITKREYLTMFYDEKLIFEQDFFSSDDYHRFRYWMITSSPHDDILYHKLFNTNLINNGDTFLVARNNFM